MTRASTRELFARCYSQVATDLLTPLVRLLCMSRTDFNGDLDRFLIIASVGLRTTTDPEFRRMSVEQLASGHVATALGLGANVRSIADSLGLPRETARRKINDLLQAGWLVRRDNRLYLTDVALRRLAPIRDQLLDFACRCIEIGGRLREAEDRPRGRITKSVAAARAT